MFPCFVKPCYSRLNILLICPLREVMQLITPEVKQKPQCLNLDFNVR